MEVENENFGRDPEVTPSPRSDERVLVECLRSAPGRCTAASRAAARRLPSVRMLPPVGLSRVNRAAGGWSDGSKDAYGVPARGDGYTMAAGVNHAAAARAGMMPLGSNGTHVFPALGVNERDGGGSDSGGGSSAGSRFRFRSCAVVGNAGHLTEREWGRYIDAHDVVARMNRQAVAGFTAHVGSKTTHRFVNHNDGLAVCCRGVLAEKRGLKEDGRERQHPRVILWHLAARQRLLAACKARYAESTTLALDFAYIKAAVAQVREMRKDLLRLGFGPFGFWRQLTGGAHAVFSLLPMCDSVSLYGFTTWVQSDVYGRTKRDQYAGKAMRSRASSEIWHDWEAEKMIWRLLHAAGRVNVCSL